MNKHFLVVLVSSTVLASCVLGKGEDQACAQYCSLMEENCPSTGFVGGSTEHDRDECLSACAEYPDDPVLNSDGEEIPLGDPVPDDNSLACRTYHADNATGDPDGVHCGHASPDGGGKCVEFKEPCDQFCVGASAEAGGGVRPDGFNGVVEFCISAADGPAFENRDACAAFCNGIPKGEPDDAAGRTRFCFLNQALQAFEAMDQTQCPELGAESTVCSGG